MTTTNGDPGLRTSCLWSAWALTANFDGPLPLSVSRDLYTPSVVATRTAGYGAASISERVVAQPETGRVWGLGDRSAALEC